MKSNITNQSKQESESQRLDTWLWASRFYKTRKLATEAIKGGHVAVNGQRAKPAKSVSIDDQLVIKKHPNIFTVHIQALSAKRLGAQLAVSLYSETDESRSERLEKETLMKAQRAGLKYDRGRPNKRDRDKMMRFKHQTDTSD